MKGNECRNPMLRSRSASAGVKDVTSVPLTLTYLHVSVPTLLGGMRIYSTMVNNFRPPVAPDGDGNEKDGNEMKMDKDWQSGKTFAETNITMFENEDDTDVTFTFPSTKETVRAHRFILTSRSHIFYVTLNSNLYDPAKAIEIQEIEPAVFEQFLRFLYCGEPAITAENALPLLYTAQKYETMELTAKCLKFLEENITKDTVALILDQTVFYNEDKLSQKCLQFLSTDKELEALQYHHVSKETMEMIVGCDDILENVLPVFRTCNTWSDIECKNRGFERNGDNKRMVLGSVLKKIPYSKMTHEQIASTVSPSGLLSLEEQVELFRSVLLTKKPNSSLLFVEVPLCILLQPPENQLLVSLQNDQGYQFKIMGFIFPMTGNFEFILSSGGVHTKVHFPDAKANAEMYLTSAILWTGGLLSAYTSGFNLSSGGLNSSIFSCTTQTDTRIEFYVYYNGGSPPFKTILMELV